MSNFEAERRVEMEQARNRLREIWNTVYTDRQPIGRIQARVTGPGLGPERMPKSGWRPFSVHDRWGGFDQTTWFRMTVAIPKRMKGQCVVALIRPGGESLAYVNGQPFQGLDRNRDELFLAERSKGGERFEIALESVPSVRFDEYHHFEYADIAVMHREAWDFYWDARVVYTVLEQLEKNSTPRQQLLELLKDAMFKVDLQHVGAPAYHASLIAAGRFLRTGLKRFEASYGMGKLILTGQSHIDTAWLWPLRETRRKCGRTFSTMLNLMDRYPEFVFLASQPVQYEWMKEHYPELFRRIKQRVKEGRWEVFGALWVENDCNVPSGEAVVRQLLYGNRFFRKEFGIHSTTAWLPDAFGYAWSLPQIFKKAQVDTFVTTKITWSRFTEFPYSVFQWEGADGTRILGMMPPLNYNGNTHPRDCIEQWKLFRQKDRFEEVPFPYGHGDGGGGVTMEMIEFGKRLGNIVGVPKCELGRIQDCIDRMKTQCRFEDLPVWNSELYLEYHRGCQTTQARTKRNNRKLEFLLRQTEFLSSWALMHGGRYDRAALYDAWKIVLTNQFHDILPGSSITEVYAQADQDYARARGLATSVRAAALNHLAGRIDTSGPGRPVLVFNDLSWVRTDAARVEMPLPQGDFHVVDGAGAGALCQQTGPNELLILAEGVPPLGYAAYHVVPGASSVENTLKAASTGMENDFIRLTFDKKGRIARLYDKIEHRDLLVKGQPGNVLELFEDRPHGNDAWDIDPNFEEVSWEPRPAESIEVVETGPVRAIVRMVRKTERSVITQDVTLHAHTSRIDFVTHVDWHEKRVLLKAAFPVNVRASHATYEIQFAAIERATHRNTDFDRARYEVPAHKWADLSEGDYGVSLLSDCKYGYETKGNRMRISLLRSPVDPDPKADEGEHLFTYAIYPHAWTWRNGTVQEGFELNSPLLAFAAPAKKGMLPPCGAFASVDADHVVIDTIKRSEDSNALIVRVYEAYGQRGPVALTFGRTPKRVTECDLMEENDTPIKTKGATVCFDITPFEIRSFKVAF
ncbi:MAG TPA: alpha-mannosidase [Candidatus Hydrogenedentes bacterium]|nr:alpha-mannosidase [Candidatus Hydrogenedentota bacterium]